jgi:subtilisin family serine protease
MPDQKQRRFKLKAVKPWDFDPHLQEVIRAREAGPEISPAIGTWEGRATLLVDVIARLEKPDAKIPEAVQEVRRIGKESTILTGKIDVTEIEATHKEVASLKAATELYLSLHNSVPAIHCEPETLDQTARDVKGRAYPGLSGTDVIVGIVDFGCDFVHSNFRQPSGATRILYLWDQSDPPRPDPSGAHPPKGFFYGRELDSAKINEALQAEDPYERLGYTPPIAAHGTHVMDIAAGNGREPNRIGNVTAPAINPSSHPGIAPNAFIVFVHLKADEDSFLGNSRNLLEAVDYIFEKADHLGLPAVVNLSLSTSGGPHDGTTLVEQGFEALLKEAGRAIVTAAGNAFAQGGHVSGTIEVGKTRTLRWYTDPRAAKNEMEVWYPGSAKDLHVTLKPPTGEPLEMVPLGQVKDLYEGEIRRGRISHRKEDPNNHDNQIDIRVPHLDDTTDPWEAVITNGGAGPVSFHAWIEQDDLGTARFDQPTETAYTLGSICCSEKTLTVGAFDTSERACLAPPYEGTAAGPTRPKGDEKEGRNKPDLSAPGKNIVAARAHGGTTIMSGTSMAAAHVTGLVALLFELAKRAGKRPPSTDDIRRILKEAAHNASQFKVDWDPQLGVGRIHGAETLPGVLNLESPPPRLMIPMLASVAATESEESPDDLLKKLVARLLHAELKLKVGNDGEVATAKLKELVSILGQTSFELSVAPPH